MTQTPQPMARVALTYGSTVDCLSIDLLDSGVLLVDTDGDTLMYPWHCVAVIGFYDTTPVPAPEPALPKGHEGSE